MIPERVNVGGHDIKIIVKKDREEMGRYNAINNTIKLKAGLSESKAEQVLCHEIIHFLLYESGTTNVLGVEGSDNYVLFENVTRTLENIFWRFLKDNTNFFNNPSETK